MSENQDHLRRSRFIQSMIDSRILHAGEKYDILPELYLIFITQKDFLRVNTGVKRIVHMIEGTGRSVDNGVHEIYANLEYPAENDEMTRLLNYISDTNGTTETTGFENLAKRVNYLKNEAGGVQYMCETLERERTEGRVEGDFFRLIKTVKNMKKKGMGVVEIADLLAEETGYIEKVLSFTEKAGTEDIQEVYQCMMDDV